MPTCRVCSTPNAEGSGACEHCNSVFEDTSQTVVSTQTVVASSFSAVSAGSAAAAARAFNTELIPGVIIAGRYEILVRIGQGGMGTVYKALDHELDRVIALKTIRPDLLSNPAALRRLKQETLLSRQISHRNVIRVFDLGVADGLRFIIMEFVQGEDLRSVLDASSGKLEHTRAVAIMRQVCQGLQAAHAEDVTHRDLKPQNILIGPDGRARIMDFGLARSLDDTALTQTGALLGTPAYMSPEQALGRPGESRSDIFSLGVMFYELLTGKLPFPNNNLSDSILSRTRGRAQPIERADPAVPPRLARIVMKCLARDPADRYRTAQQIVDDLDRSEEHETVGFSPPTDTFLPGMMLGSRYRIEAEAGEGGMGKVYRATDLELNRTVAIKVVRPELAANPQALEQLRQEISLASQITHKNVLRIHDLGEAAGLRFVSMAWAEDEDLAHLLHRCGPLPEERVLELGIEITEGLRAAHEQGIVHRDLKPSNILLGSNGHACIADFGLARSLEPHLCSITVGDGISGTPRYMSPEQVEGKTIDQRSDIYSLGLILHELATGKIPFKDNTAFQTMTERVTDSAAHPKLLNPALSDRLASVIVRCLERDPEKRFATAQELLTSLHAVAAAPNTRLHHPGAIEIRRGWIYFFTPLLLALAAFAFWYSRRPRPVEPPRDGKYIAVLPFRSLGSDPNLKYRAEGVADAISSRLASLSSVHPVSSSALDRVNLAQSEEKIGQQLGANLLINGTIQAEGDRIRVIASIYDTAKHSTIWNKAFDPGLIADFFNLEDQICNDIVKGLDVTPTNQDRERTAPQPTQNLAAYDLYYKGQDILKNKRDEASAQAALALFKQAGAQDSNYALAWTGIADANLLLYRLNKDSLSASEALAAAEQARSINADLPEAHLALGAAYTATGRNAEAVNEIKQALALTPNSDSAYIRLGRAYLATGQKDAAINALKKAVDLNPYYWYNHKQLGAAYYQLGNNDDALRQFKEQVTQNPADWSGPNNIGAIYFQQGRWKESIPFLEQAIKLQPSFDTYSNLGTAFSLLGKHSEAVAKYEQAVAISPNQAATVRNLAEQYRYLGDRKKAEATYNRAISLAYDQLQVNPQNASAFGILALSYAGKGDISKARGFIKRARSINAADSDLMYDEAIVETANNRLPEALSALKNALRNGTSFAYCLDDPDLKTLRASPGFKALKKEFSR